MAEFELSASPHALQTALRLQAGLKAWAASDPEVSESSLAKAFRDNWDRRVGKKKFGCVWSIVQARGNPRHPASKAALRIPRNEWSGDRVTVEHAIPVKVMYGFFGKAQTDRDMLKIIEAYTVAVVTKEEDKRLTDAGLGSSMPEGWRLGEDPLARWSRVGIEVELGIDASSV